VQVVLQRFFVFLFIPALLASCGGGAGAPNTAPVLESIPNKQLFENSDERVALTSVSDAESDLLSLALLGPDAGQFEFRGNGIWFTSSPDFENPTDANGDNVYELRVTVTDGELSDETSFEVSVLNAFEGRVIDAPLAGSRIFLDLNASGEADEGEADTLSDENGFYTLAVPGDADGGVITSLAGLDSATGNLVNLVLKAPLPEDESSQAVITLISTILAQVDSQDSRETILKSLGIDVESSLFLSSDLWAEASEDEAFAQAQRVNSQLAVLVQTVATALEAVASVDEVTSAVAVSIIATAVEEGDVELSTSDSVSSILNDVIEETATDESLPDDVVTVIAGAVANINTVLGDSSNDPLSNVTAEVVSSSQTDLLDAVGASCNRGDRC
jgi:hypothetical protein